MAYSTDPYALKPEDVKRLGGSSFTKPFGPVPKQPGFTDPFSGGSRLVNQGFASPVSTVPHPGAFGQRPQPPFVDAFRSRPTAPPPPAAQPAQPNPAGAMPIGGAAAPGNPPPVESGSVTRATITPKTPAPATTRTGDVIAASPAVYAPVQTAKPAPMEVSAAATPAAQVKPAEMQVADQAAVNSIQVAKPAPMNVADQAAVNPVKTTEVKPAEPPAGEVTQPQNFDDSLAEFQKTAANWQAGIDDPIFRTAANRLITRLGLMNQADQDALQMQINQDPELRGQGAGRALLAMMSRDQNFKLDDQSVDEAVVERIPLPRPSVR